MADYQLQIVLPVHNEAESIGATLQAIYDELSPKIRLQFILCEDGSTDNTKEVLTELSKKLPMHLIMTPGRKGYSRAVIDGLEAAQAPYVLCLDSDGQYDPKDFWKFWEARDRADIIVGWRHPRRDPLFRLIMSRCFKIPHVLFFRTGLHDPSCPFVLLHRSRVKLMFPKLGLLDQGLWWEFTARAKQHGLAFFEIPVKHLVRAAGKTQVYKLKKIPRIALTHLRGLLEIRKTG